MNILLTALFPIWYLLMCDGTLGSMVLFCSCLLSESIWQQTNYLKQSVWVLSVFWSIESCKYQINIVFLSSCVLENGPVSQSISHLYTGIYSVMPPLTPCRHFSTSSVLSIGRVLPFAEWVSFWLCIKLLGLPFVCLALPPTGVFASSINCSSHAPLSCASGVVLVTVITLSAQSTNGELSPSLCRLDLLQLVKWRWKQFSVYSWMAVRSSGTVLYQDMHRQVLWPDRFA